MEERLFVLPHLGRLLDPMSDLVYFTVDEANAMIPRLEQGFARLLQMHAQVREVYERLDATGFAPESDEFELEAPGAGAGVVRDRATLRVLIDAIRDEVAELSHRGCLIKSIDSGLVDWYAQAPDGREVLLCWKFGEGEVGYYHEIDAGYRGRRPVSELLRSRPEPARSRTDR